MLKYLRNYTRAYAFEQKVPSVKSKSRSVLPGSLLRFYGFVQFYAIRNEKITANWLVLLVFIVKNHPNQAV
jgi:hypothetical protein